MGGKEEREADMEVEGFAWGDVCGQVRRGREGWRGSLWMGDWVEMVWECVVGRDGRRGLVVVMERVGWEPRWWREGRRKRVWEVG